jgi:hypothetical protein
VILICIHNMHNYIHNNIYEFLNIYMNINVSKGDGIAALANELRRLLMKSDKEVKENLEAASKDQ